MKGSGDAGLGGCSELPLGGREGRNEKETLPAPGPCQLPTAPTHISLHSGHSLGSGWAGSGPSILRGTAGPGAQRHAEGDERESCPTQVNPSLSRQTFRPGKKKKKPTNGFERHAMDELRHRDM